MREYKSLLVNTTQSWTGAKGTMDTKALDEALNWMAKDDWELVCVEDLEHPTGSGHILCIFSRQAGK